MVYVNFFGFTAITVGMCFVAKPGITEGKHVKAVYAVGLVKAAVTLPPCIKQKRRGSRDSQRKAGRHKSRIHAVSRL